MRMDEAQAKETDGVRAKDRSRTRETIEVSCERGDTYVRGQRDEGAGKTSPIRRTRHPRHVHTKELEPALHPESTSTSSLATPEA